MNKTHKERLKKFKMKNKIKEKRNTGYVGSTPAYNQGKTVEPQIRTAERSKAHTDLLEFAANSCSLSETIHAVKNMSDNAVARLYRCAENEYRKRNIHEKTMERFKNSI